MMLPVAVVAGCALVALVVLVFRYAEYQKWHRDLVSYQLRLPHTLEVTEVVAWLSSLSALSHATRGAVIQGSPIVFELVAGAEGVSHQISVARGAEAGLLASVRASLPGARLEQCANSQAQSGARHAAAEVWLSGRTRQLAVERAELVSRNLLAAAQPLNGNESLRWQWIISGAGTPRPISPTNQQRGSALPWWLAGTEPVTADSLRSGRLKQAQPQLKVVGRLVATAVTRRRAWSLFGQAWGAIRLLNTPGARLVRHLWPSFAVADRARRSVVPLLVWPAILNAAEFAGLLGFPLGKSPLPGLPVGVTRQLPPPRDLPRTGTIIADSTYPGFEGPITISSEDRKLHVALLGPTGTGKSNAMNSIALQSAASGDGLAILDPKADSAAEFLPRVPAHRLDDVIVVNPADLDRPVPFNVLAHDGTEAGRELTVDHVLHVFREQWKESWGPRTDAVLRASLLTLTHTSAVDGSAFTVCELPGLLTDTAFRRWVTGQETVPASVHDFWEWFEALSRAEQTQVIGPVMNKLSALTQRTPLRLILGQSQGLNLAEAMQQNRILVMPLSRGLVGSETAALLSSLMLSSIWQAGLGRVRIPREQRRDFWLYIDEAAEVVRLPLDLADVMSEARGLGIGLTLATQYVAQLPQSVRRALLSTVRSQVIFQVEVDDAKLLARSFEPSLTADDLRSLPRYEVAMRLAVNGQTSRPMTGRTRPLPDPTTNADELRARSRERYGQPRAAIEQALLTRRQVPSGASSPTQFGRRPRTGDHS